MPPRRTSKDGNSSKSSSRSQGNESWPSPLPPESRQDSPQNRVPRTPDVILPPVLGSRSNEDKRPSLPPLSMMLRNQEGAFLHHHPPALPPPSIHQLNPSLAPIQSEFAAPVVSASQSAQRTAEDEQSVAISVYMADPDAVPQTLDNGRFQCPLCPRSYKYAKHVRRHIINHTNLYPYSCPRCSALFRRKDAQRRHMQRIHPDVAVPSSSQTSTRNLGHHFAKDDHNSGSDK